MKITTKISIIFLALLIPIINSGVLISKSYTNNLAETQGTVPSSEKSCFQEAFLTIVTDLSLNDNPVPHKSLKYLKKVKQNWNIKTITSTNKSYQFPQRSEEQDPALVTDIFDLPDIIFPFDYFL